MHAQGFEGRLGAGDAGLHVGDYIRVEAGQVVGFRGVGADVEQQVAAAAERVLAAAIVGPRHEFPAVGADGGDLLVVEQNELVVRALRAAGQHAGQVAAVDLRPGQRLARQGQDRGLSPVEAAVEACRLRLRPILMTAFAFILGVVPLMIAEGPGAEMRQSLGTAVFSGMLGVTLVGLVLTPVFYVTLRTLVPVRRKTSLAAEEIPAE